MQMTKCNEMDRLSKENGNKIVKRLGNGPKWSNYCTFGKRMFRLTFYLCNKQHNKNK